MTTLRNKLIVSNALEGHPRAAELSTLLDAIETAMAKAEDQVGTDTPDGDYYWCLMRMQEAHVHLMDAFAAESRRKAAPTAMQRINADHTAQLRRDARSDDGTRAADAYATSAALQDYARAKGRL